jgi:drug/metabolite transporter (DMT)-like permease
VSHPGLPGDGPDLAEMIPPAAGASAEVLAQARVNRLGIATMVVSCLLFSLNDAFMKLGTAHLAPSELMLIRGAIASACLFLALVASGEVRNIPQLLRPWTLFRSVCDTFVALTYVEALGYLPLADITSVSQSTPIIMTAMAATVLRERVGAWHWLAVLVGFGGVLLIAKPSVDHFQWPVLLAFSTAVIISIRDLVTRRKTAGVSSLVMTFGSTIASGSAGLTLIGTEVWRWPTGYELICAGGAAVMLALANLCIIRAFRAGDVSVISPFRYASVPIAVVLGAIVWGVVPDRVAALGIILIVAAGLATMQLDRRRLRAALAAI